MTFIQRNTAQDSIGVPLNSATGPSTFIHKDGIRFNTDAESIESISYKSFFKEFKSEDIEKTLPLRIPIPTASGVSYLVIEKLLGKGGNAFVFKGISSDFHDTPLAVRIEKQGIDLRRIDPSSYRNEREVTRHAQKINQLLLPLKARIPQYHRTYFAPDPEGTAFCGYVCSVFSLEEGKNLRDLSDSIQSKEALSGFLLLSARHALAADILIKEGYASFDMWHQNVLTKDITDPDGVLTLVDFQIRMRDYSYRRFSSSVASSCYEEIKSKCLEYLKQSSAHQLRAALSEVTINDRPMSLKELAKRCRTAQRLLSSYQDS